MEIDFKYQLKKMVKSTCKYKNEKGLDHFIYVDHEIRVNKLRPEEQKRDSARIDLIIVLAMSADPKDRLLVVIELKKDEGDIKDHTIMKEKAKNYDSLDFLDQEETILYLSASMNTRDNDGNPQSHRLSYFLSYDIDDKK